MKKTVLSLIFSGFIPLIPFSHAITPEEIILKADEVRNPAESFFMKVRVSSTKESEISEFDVFLKGNNKTLIKTRLPEKDSGRNLLMIEENMWVYIPNLKRSVRISLSQKLTGQTANGDIARTRWHDDYQASIKEEKPQYWVMDLNAKKKGLTYEKITVRIQKKDFHPMDAEYGSASGKILKRAQFGSYKQMEGKIRPGKIKIEDAVNQSDSSVIEIVQMKKQNVPDSLFNKDQLGTEEMD